MQKTSRKALGLVAVIAVATGAAAEKKEFRYPVKPDAGISITNDFGPVTLRAASGREIVVTATPHSAKVKVDGTQYGNRVDVRTRYLQAGSQDERRVDYKIQVPPDTDVVIHTSAGPVKVLGVGGDVSVDSDNSPVEVRDSNGQVRVRTIGAAITLANLHGGHVEATSVSGPVTLQGVSGKMVSVNTTAGTISFSGDCAGGGQYALSTHSGDIDVALPESASVDVSAHSVTGNVEDNFPLKPLPQASLASNQGKSFAGLSNSGASSLRLRSFSGKIRVKKQ